MLDKLLDFLVGVLDKLTPVLIVKQYEQAALFRGGKFRCVLEPGVHLRIPVYDDVDFYMTAMTTINLPVQSVTTKDGESVVVKAAIKYEIADLSVFGVKVYDAKSALSDMTCGIIFDAARGMEWATLKDSDFGAIVTKSARKEARRWGVSIDVVTITDLSRMRSLRLFNEASQPTA